MAKNNQEGGSSHQIVLTEIIDRADRATTREELLASQQHIRSLMREGFRPAEKAERPYAGALEMTEAFREAYAEPAATGSVEGAFGDVIGGMAIDAANALARAERRVNYRLKTLFGFRGLRLVEEGDSWTQYPILLDDIVDQLDENSDFAIFSVGAAGDLATNIAQQKEYLKALRKTGAQGLIISCGGNDLFGDFEKMLVGYSAGVSPEQLINKPVFEPVFNAVISSYQTILTDVANNHPTVTVFGHGYDLPYPQEDGSWIGPALLAKGIPLDVGRDVLRVIMDDFNEALLTLATANANFIMSDLRKKVDKGPNSWFDELHPKNAGYGRASAVLESAIRNTLDTSDGSESLAFKVEGQIGSSRDLEVISTSAQQTIVLDPGHGGTTRIGGSSPNNAVGPRGTLEKTLTLDIARRTRDLLENSGFRVLLTRDSDVNLSLKARAQVAKDAKAAAFLSIHFNGFNGAVQGTETFIDKGASAASGVFSLAVQKEMLAALGHRDRNFRKVKYPNKPLGVLNPASHHSNTAVALHEVSFMDAPDEEDRLSKVSYRRKIAVALADGIEAYLDDTFPVSGLELASEGFGDAIELVAARVGLSSEDLVSRKVNHLSAFSDPGVETTSLTAAGSPTSGSDLDLVSNGHMIAGSKSTFDSAALWALAASEARGFTSAFEHSSGEDSEGDEPNEFDPNVEQAFSSMSANVEANFNLLQLLFGLRQSYRSPMTSANASATPMFSATGFDMNRFIAFMNGLDLKHFSPAEFLVFGRSHHGTGSAAGLNTYPPETLWVNIANTAKMLDEIRDRLGVSVFINSAYRSPAYNAAIGGAARSQHMGFNAIDWRASTGTPDQWHTVAKAVEASNVPAYGGWSNAYLAKGFVHIDTRFATVSLA